MGKLVIMVGAVALVGVALFKTQFAATAPLAGAIACSGNCDVADLMMSSRSESLDAARIAFDGMLRRAHRMTHRHRAALVWREGRYLAATLRSEQTLVGGRLRAVPLTTKQGERCRHAFVRILERDQSALRQLQRGLAAPTPSWATVERYETARRQSDRAYAKDVKPCFATVTP
jgi:hypothetical protein